MSRKTFDACARRRDARLGPARTRPAGRPAPAAHDRGPGRVQEPRAPISTRRTSTPRPPPGRQLIAKYDGVLDTIEERYGVPRGILVAIWARESSFGRAAIPEPAIRTLATHAFMSRRKDFFRPELIAALQILQAGDISVSQDEELMGRRLGRPQFLPSYYLKYAVDGDGDGRPRYLGLAARRAGVDRQFPPERGGGTRIGAGASRPPSPPAVACHLEGPEQGRGMAEWA